MQWRPWMRWVHLRPYQEECIQACLKGIREGKRRLGVSLATGSGKTLIFSTLIQRIEPIEPNATQTLILTHRRELVDQAYRQCSQLYPEKTIEVEMGKASASGLADITIASVPTMVSHERMQKFDPARFKLILIDEVHHAVTPSYMRILKHFSAMSSESKIIVIGLSATIFRLDGLKLGVAIDHIAYHQNLIDLINEKWLSNIFFTTICSGIDLSKVKNDKFGDFEKKSLSNIINTRPTNDICVRTWIKKALFCVSITHCLDMANTFRSYGIDARIVTSKTSKSERLKLLEDFQKQKYPVLINCGILTEGTDIPNIDCVLLARPTKSHNLFLQMIGRGMRLFPGKTDCHVIDMVGNVSHGILTVPTLFGLDPKEISNETILSELKHISENEKKTKSFKHNDFEKPPVLPIQSTSSNIEYTEWDFTHDSIKDFQLITNVRKLSKLPWVHIKDNKYILSIPIFGFIKIDKDDKTNAYYASETIRIRSSSAKSHTHKKSRVILPHVTSLKHAIFAVDTYVMKKYPRKIIFKNATWRKSPATSTQIALINKINPSINRNINNMTKGLAWDLITKLTHGAKTFSKQTKSAN
ncbi:hypothetical protein PMAC_003241 [Pneumocystis sp. 'macacae']|nr:hypothetical protein PMAC_003241 [Pneumocystis sp. 'macacae']